MLAEIFSSYNLMAYVGIPIMSALTGIFLTLAIAWATRSLSLRLGVGFHLA